MKQPLLIQQFDTFHERVDRAFKSMIPSSSVAIRDEEDDHDNARGGEGAGSEWRTSATLEIRRGSKFDDDEEEEENKDDDEEREGRESDCLFGTKKETRNSIGKCDRLTNEEEFDGDDLIAVGTTNFDGVGLQLTVGEPKKRKSLGGGGSATVPDHEKFPLKYTKYSFDEPVYVGGGGGIGGRGGSWGGSRGGRKGDGEEEERRERKKETKAATDDEEKTAPKVEEPRIMRGKKKRNGAADVAASGDKKRTRRVTRSSTMVTRSIAAQDAENGE